MTKNASEELKNDIELVMEAVQQNGCLLLYACNEFRKRIVDILISMNLNDLLTSKSSDGKLETKKNI
jgi:hypothetical protein